MSHSKSPLLPAFLLARARQACGAALAFALPLWAWDGFSSTGYAAGGAAYLDFAAHANSAALCQAVTAWQEGICGAQVNPAILDKADGYSLMGSYSFMTEDRRLISADAALPIGQYLVAGISFMQAGLDQLELRDDYGELQGTFDDRENTAAVSVAGRLMGNISIGGRARYLNQNFSNVDQGSAQGIGFDVGATFAPDSHVCLGASVLNIGSYLFWATGQVDPVLPEARAGVAGLFFHKRLIVEADVIKTLQQPIDAAMGIEYTLFGIIAVRGGATTSIDIQERHARDPDYSAGVGLHYGFFGFDYAIEIPTESVGLTHKISLLLKIGSTSGPR